MTRLAKALVLAGFVGTAACGGADPPQGMDPQPAEPAVEPAAEPDSGLVAQETIDGCAGYTSGQAAAVLGLDPAIVTDYSRTEGRLRNCVYRQADRNTGIVSFTLNRKDSVDLAKRSMGSEREAMGMADRAISGVTGGRGNEPATVDVSEIGDEAFYSPLNGAIMLRVDNAIAQVTGPDDLALRTRVAEQVAEGLRR
jgi:hypothetical protein